MAKWKKLILIAIVTVIFAVLIVLLPVERWNDKLQPWDSLLAIISSFTSLVFGIWGWNARKNQADNPPQKIKNKNFQARDHSTVAEMIKDTTIIHADKIIMASQDLAQEIKSPVDLKEVTQAYYQFLVNLYTNLSFKGMGVSDRVPLDMPLLQLYVPLKGRREMPKSDTWERNYVGGVYCRMRKVKRCA